MNYKDREAVRNYKAGYMRGLRMSKYRLPATATPLAIQCMKNEIERQAVNYAEGFANSIRKHLDTEGNEVWRALAN
jgi:hypothetical protein